MDDDARADLAPETLAIHADCELNDTPAVAPPIYQTSTFRAASAEEFAEMAAAPRTERFYTRYGNPTNGQAEAVVAALEGAETAMMSASGMGAISTAVLALVNGGDHVIAQENHYAGTTALVRDLLPRFGVEVTFVDQRDPANFERAIRPATKLIIMESPSNPLMRLTDLRAVAALAAGRGIITLADNTFATPVNQRPLESGVTLVAHSATKYMGGHSDVCAGAIAGPSALLARIWETSLVLGGVLSPFDGWLVLRGLRTLSLRVERQNQTAQAVARFLEAHPKVKCVHYPGLESHPQHELACRQMSGFTGILSFELPGESSAAERFMGALQLAAHAASVGGVETLVARPTAMLSQQVSEEQFREVGVSPNLIRLSVGLENERDLIADIEQALASV